MTCQTLEKVLSRLFSVAFIGTCSKNIKPLSGRTLKKGMFVRHGTNKKQKRYIYIVQYIKYISTVRFSTA